MGRCRRIVRGADPKDIDATGYLAGMSARIGNVSVARALSEKLRSLKGPYLYGEHTRWRASIAAQLGNRDEAVGLLREAFAQGQRYDDPWLHLTPTLDPLRGYPPFEELVRPKG